MVELSKNKRMLIVTAHPDDESFAMAGSIARYVNEGVSVYLICATNGDVGEVAPVFMEGFDTVAELRLAELSCAAETLGLSGLTLLGYRDSGMAGTEDNRHPDSLCSASLDEVSGRITHVIRELRPQVVVTFDPYGGYGHPDHIVVHDATVQAFDAAGDPDQYPDQLNDGLLPYQPQKLYYHTFDRRLVSLTINLMPLFGTDPERMGKNGDINFREITAHSYPIHARINTRMVEEQAQQARECHASQLGGLTRPGLLQRLMVLFQNQHVDTYMRAYPPVNGSRVRERDLFEDVVLN
ncbi:MAG: PIG-L family deacetylase [Anaerolineae bacterium]|nr:PIG-L family deacetylase [Anaerolineae bacterium]